MRTFLASAGLSLIAAAAPASQLLYYGGPVIGNVQIVQVNWSSLVNDTVQNSMPGFYADIVASDYLAMLHEYATTLNGQDGQPGSNQQIGLGSFAGSYTLSPSTCSNASTCYVTDTQVGSELDAQITAGNLPPPQTDGSGHDNTIYMVHFPPNVIIVVQGSYSCQDFCGNYADFTHNSIEAAFGMLADQQTTACVGQCGTASTGLPAETIVSSHILGDMIADPFFGVTIPARPMAWFDPTAGGVAQKCNGQGASASVNGNAYLVTRLWSNAAQACLVTNNRVVVDPTNAGHGTVSPSLPQGVAPNTSVVFTLQPDAGFQIGPIGGTCGGLLSGSTYTTNPVAADCSVAFTFTDRIFGSGFESP